MIIIGSDHAGVARKEVVKRLLTRLGEEFVDIGSHNPESGDDYPDFARAVAERVLATRHATGILLCGSGSGMAIAANKMPGIRAAVGHDAYAARMARRDNDANILALRARNFPAKAYEPIIRAWLREPFSGEARHRRRIRKLKQLEGRCTKCV